MLGEAYQQSLPRARRRAAGVFYTPPALVAQVVAQTLAPLLPAASWRADGSPRLRVLDPACGAGRFLVAVVDALVAASPRGEGARRAIVRRCVTGVERDPAAALLARTALGPGADVRVGEALLGGVAEDGVWDAVVGNPPWIRSVALKRDDPALWVRLRGTFAATSYREWDLYAAFLERALAWAKPGGGEIGLVTPSRWLSAAFAAPLRARLAEARAVRRIVDFGPEQLFDGATTYTALVYLTRRDGGAAAIDVTRDGVRGEVPMASLGAAPWRLEVGARARTLARAVRGSRPLGELARISKGAGTNADGVFLLPPDLAATLEPEALVPCLRGRDIAPYRAVVARHALLPYEGDRLLAPDELRDRWPRAAAWLARHRAQLEARERGRFAGPTYYRWGRPQNLLWLRDPAPKIVVPDATSRGRAALDTAGTLVIDTAYAIRPLPGARVTIEELLDLLNSPLVATWLRATGIPLRGGYFRMKTAYLASLPVR